MRGRFAARPATFKATGEMLLRAGLANAASENLEIVGGFLLSEGVCGDWASHGGGDS